MKKQALKCLLKPFKLKLKRGKGMKFLPKDIFCHQEFKQPKLYCCHSTSPIIDLFLCHQGTHGWDCVCYEDPEENQVITDADDE